MGNKKKIVLLVPAKSAKGGISFYYETLRKELTTGVIFFERGARNWPHRAGLMAEYKRIFTDFLAFRSLFTLSQISLVQSSTSLGLNTTLRDGLFLFYARKRGAKTIAFFRGWDFDEEHKLESTYLWLFRFLFFKCDRLITLSKRVKEKLSSWGYDGEIIVETTLVDKMILSGIDTSTIKNRLESSLMIKDLNLLFMSRVEKRKGIYEVLEAFEALTLIYKDRIVLHLDILGDGFEMDNIKKLADEKGLRNIQFHGFVKGVEKKQILQNSDIFLFPSYGEGMPNAVLEAMAAGLVVVTTKVGGLADFFVDGEHGLIINAPTGSALVTAVRKLLDGPEIMIDLALEAHDYACKNFYSNIVAARLMNIFKETIGN